MSKVTKRRIDLLVYGFARENYLGIPCDVNDLTKIWLLDNDDDATLNVSLMREQKHLAKIQRDPELYQDFPILLNMDKSHVFDIWFDKPFPYQWLLPISKYKLRYIVLEKEECDEILKEQGWFNIEIDPDAMKSFVDNQLQNNENDERILSVITNKVYDIEYNISFADISTNSDDDSFIYQVQAMYDEDNIITQTDWKLYNGSYDNPLSPQPFAIREDKWRQYWKDVLLKGKNTLRINGWLEPLEQEQELDVEMINCRKFFWYIAYRKDEDHTYSMNEQDWVKYVMNYWYLSREYWIVRYAINIVVDE